MTTHANIICMPQLQAWDQLQMTVKLAKQLKVWHVQSFAFQGNYAAFSNHSRLVWCHNGIQPQALCPSIATASEHCGHMQLLQAESRFAYWFQHCLCCGQQCGCMMNIFTMTIHFVHACCSLMHVLPLPLLGLNSS